MKLYKYREFNTFSEEIIKSQSLYFSPIDYFNDPFDCNLSYRDSYTKKEIQSYFKFLSKKFHTGKERYEENKKKYKDNDKFVQFMKQITAKEFSKIGILSLSSNNDSILMWSHYSNNHQGLVFEFKPKLKHYCFGETFPPLRVDYKEEYEKLSYTVTDDEKKKDQYVRLLLTKFTDWKYEEEYRVIDLNYNGTKSFHKEELTGIIFGAKAKKEDINNIIKLCEDNGLSHVKFKQAEIETGKFSVVIKDYSE